MKLSSLFTLTLTLAGLIIDAATFILRLGFNFYGWLLIVGILLFALSFTLTKLFYKLPRHMCVASSLVYALASHPIVGILFIIPLFARFHLCHNFSVIPNQNKV